MEKSCIIQEKTENEFCFMCFDSLQIFLRKNT